MRLCQSRFLFRSICKLGKDYDTFSVFIVPDQHGHLLFNYHYNTFVVSNPRGLISWCIELEKSFVHCTAACLSLKVEYDSVSLAIVRASKNSNLIRVELDNSGTNTRR